MLTRLLALDIKQEHDLKDGQFRHIGSGAIKIVMGVGPDLETERWAYTNQNTIQHSAQWLWVSKTVQETEMQAFQPSYLLWHQSTALLSSVSGLSSAMWSRLVLEDYYLLGILHWCLRCNSFLFWHLHAFSLFLFLSCYRIFALWEMLLCVFSPGDWFRWISNFW